MSYRSNICAFAHCLLCGLLLTQVAGIFPGQAQVGANSKTEPSRLPPLPVARPPIEYFRELLSMPAVERERALDGKPEEQKKILLAKIKEYEAMSADERELRLTVTELRWYLMGLMRIKPADRAERLEKVPAEKRPLVDERLQRWDELSGAQQKEFLDNEMTIHYVLRLQSSTPEQQTNLLQTIPALYRQKLEMDLAQWRSLPAEQRDRMCDRFQQFFELNPKEKQKTLGALPEAERLQMERTLQTFQKLPSEQRRHCITSFRKFARMSVEERNQFLKKADVWESMSPSDRKAWRELVNKLPQMPPLPPGLKFQPPLPPSPTMATNIHR